MQNQLFEAALGIVRPWFVQSVDFDAVQKVLTIKVDFAAGTRFPAPAVPGEHASAVQWRRCHAHGFLWLRASCRWQAALTAKPRGFPGPL